MVANDTRPIPRAVLVTTVEVKSVPQYRLFDAEQASLLVHRTLAAVYPLPTQYLVHIQTSHIPFIFFGFVFNTRKCTKTTILESASKQCSLVHIYAHFSDCVVLDEYALPVATKLTGIRLSRVT